MTDHLWNGWREAYVADSGAERRRASEAGVSVFTEMLRSGLSDEETNIVHRGSSCFAIMNAFPYTSGHLMVLPYREVAELDALTGSEAAELWGTVTDAVTALRSAYRPEGLNIGVNLGPPAGGSIAQHLHVHVVPRWIGDSNFMTTVANTRTLPETMAGSAAKVRAHWPAHRPDPLTSMGGPRLDGAPSINADGR